MYISAMVKIFGKPFGTVSGQGPYIDQRVSSVGQTGGITAHTVNIGKPQRHLDDETTALLTKTLRKNHRIVMRALSGDNEAYRFALEILSFLRKNGYKLDDPAKVGWAQYAEPFDGVKISTNDEFDLIHVSANPA